MIVDDKLSGEWDPPRIVLLGLGAGNCGLKKYRSWIDKAEVVVAGKEILQLLKARENVQKIPIESPLGNILQKIKGLSKTKRVLVIASGDPLFFGIGKRLSSAVSREHLLVLPNISFVQYLFARTAIPWDDALCFSLHGRRINRAFFYWLREGKKIALFTDSHNNPAVVADLLLKGGFSDAQVVVGERLGTDDERIVQLAVKDVCTEKWRDPNVMVILPSGRIGNCGYIEEDFFLRDSGMITKREIRSVVISSLRLESETVLWDIGAGSGSVSIEACYSKPLSLVCSIEKDYDRYMQLCSNITSFKCGEIEPQHADILEIIQHLPKPHRIFIGGGGSSILRIMEKIHAQFEKSTPITITAVTWETMEKIINFSRTNSYTFSAIQLCVNRFVPITRSYRLNALNPVFILTLS